VSLQAEKSALKRQNNNKITALKARSVQNFTGKTKPTAIGEFFRSLFKPLRECFEFVSNLV
jgi:hypothetical protein